MTASPNTTTTEPITVSGYASRLAQAVRHVGSAVLEGEVQKVGTSPRSGMIYFDLTDGQATLSCKVFRRDTQRLSHRPTAGDLVRVQVDRPDLYTANGALSLIVSDISLAGEGELLRRRQELLARLTAEGLCDESRWRPLPRFPSTVAVIAGKDSHGMADVVTALTDRWPAARILTVPRLVQGTAAPPHLIDALATLQSAQLADVIIMARGGGSVQDLACFDNEQLCRALFACEIPVICAIGHTENDPVCNHITWSAYTPSRSAEMAVPSVTEITDTIRASAQRLDLARVAVKAHAERVESLAQQLRPEYQIESRLRAAQHTSGQIDRTVAAFFRDHDTHLAGARTSLAATPGRAQLKLETQRATIVRHADAIARVAHTIAALETSVHESVGRLTASVRRQLQAAAEAYGNAIANLGAECFAAINRHRTRRAEAITALSPALAAAPTRHLAAAQTTVSHLADLVAARDFRRHGWMLGATGDRAIRSVSDLEPGATITLTLQDGAVAALVDNIQASTLVDHELNARKDHPNA